MRRSVAEISSAATTQLVVDGRSSGPRDGVAGAWVAVVGAETAIVWPRPPLRPPVAGPAAGAAAAIPTVLNASIMPGYTVRPSPSTTQASAGTGRFSPTPSIRPLRTTTVPLAITGPLTVTIFALRMAIAWGVSAKAQAHRRSSAITN